MRLAGKKAGMMLTEDGRQVVRLASIGLPDSSVLFVDVQRLKIWESG